MPKDIDIKTWQDRIRNGQRFQSRYGYSKTLRQYKDYYRHKFKAGTFPVNVLFSVLRSLVAQTYIKQPAVTINATKPGLQNFIHARVCESVARYLLRKRMTKGELKMTIQDCFLAGTANILHGYDSEYGWTPSEAEGTAPATLTHFDKSGYRIEYNTFIHPGMPWALRARPEDIVWPWGTINKNSAEWVALRKLRPLQDLKKDRKYKVPDELSGSFIQRSTGPEGERYEYEPYMEEMIKDQEWIELWQIHDLRTGKVYGITMDTDAKFLRNEADELQIDGLPISNLTFSPDPDFIYGIPDARIIEPQLLELNEIRTQSMKHRRVDILKILVKKGAIKVDAIDKLMDEDVKAIVEVEADDDIRAAVMAAPASSAGIIQDMAFSADLVRQDIREQIGFNRVQQGEFQGKTHVTKEEVQTVIQKSNIRIDERKDAIADLLTDIVRKDLQTVFKFWTTKQVAPIAGPDGNKYWIKYTGPEIAAEYDIEIDPYSDAPETPESRKQSAIQMATGWAKMNAGKIKQGQPVPAEIQRYFFSQFKGVDVDKLLSDQNIPQQGFGGAQAVSPQEAMGRMLGGGQ